MTFWKKSGEEKKEDDTRYNNPTLNHNNNHNDSTMQHHDNTDTARLSDLAEDDVLDVVIIGAGWAGISAAATLQKKNIHNFRILEAKNHIGGRSYTHYEKNWQGHDVACDLGSMWIQNAKGNLLNEYIKKYKIPTHVSKFNTRMYEENGQGHIKNFDDLEEELFEEGFYEYQAGRQQLAWLRGEEPLSRSRDLYLGKLEKKRKSELKQRLAEVLIRGQIELEYSGSLDEMSLLYWNTDSWIGGSNSHDHFVMAGYSSLVYAYAKDEGIMDKVILNTPVSNINSSNADGLVELTTKDGTAIRAKQVIVTVPLGVLQANTIQFIPALPKSHSNAIQRLGMGKMNKIFMFWKTEDVFWPMPKSSKIEVLGEVTDRDSIFLFYNSLSFHEEKPALYAFFKGPQVEAIERKYATSDPELYQQKISELAMQSLQNMFGNNIPQPEKVIVTNWLADEYTRGAYSFNKVGMKSRDREVLTFPIAEGRIHFAGEATHEHYFATTTGAFLTGRNAAKKVAKKL